MNILKNLLFAILLITIAYGCSRDEKKVDTIKQKTQNTKEPENKTQNMQTQNVDTTQKKNTAIEKKLTPDEIIKNQKPNFKLITADMQSYIGKEMELYGYASLYDYFNYGYGDSKKTHFNVSFKDGKGDVNVYFKINKFKDLMVLLSEKENLPIKIKGIIYRNKITEVDGTLTQPLFEGLKWEELK